MSSHNPPSLLSDRRATLRALSLLGLSNIGLGAFSSAQAQSFPARPIKVVLMFPPGQGGSDSQTRWLSEKFKELTGQPFIIDNRPGAAGSIAANAVKASSADGYTLVHSNVGMMSMTPVLNASAKFTEADFVPVASITIAYPLLVARTDFPANNLKELVALAKADPGGIAYGTWGLGSLAHVAGAWLESESNIKLNAVAYKGEVPLLTDMLGGQLSMGWMSVAAAQQHIKSGKLKIIGVPAEKRYSQFPQAATFIEQGLANFVVVSWTGLHAPKGTPPDVVAKLNSTINEALRTPDLRDRLQEQGQTVVIQSSAQFADAIKQNASRLEPILAKIAPLVRE